MMLSSKCSSRLLPLLNQALHSCKEEERLLEEQLRQCRKLLADWKTDSYEALNPDCPASEPQESRPSAEEVREVELLNKALEKAFKVRGTTKADSPKVPPVMQTAPSCPTTKEKTVKPLSKLSSTKTKPVTYHLKAPYKTMPEMRRVRGPMRAASANKTELTNLLKPTSSEKGNGGSERLAEHRELSGGTENAPLKPNSPPSTVPDGESSQQTQVKQPKALTLQDKGPTLKLPVEYQQQYIRNSRLWEKYYEIQSHLPASRPSFIQRLKTTFIAESPELSLYEIEDQAAHLQRAARSLQGRIDAASKGEGSGPGLWQQYRTLLLLEELQDEVAKTYSELNKLHQVAEQYKKWCEKLSMHTACPEVTLCRPTYRTAPPVLIYSHPNQLSGLAASRLRVLELQQKIYLQKVQSEELLAEAYSQCGVSTCSYPLLRALYSQLCEGGDAFPVLVQDDS